MAKSGSYIVEVIKWDLVDSRVFSGKIITILNNRATIRSYLGDVGQNQDCFMKDHDWTERAEYNTPDNLYFMIYRFSCIKLYCLEPSDRANMTAKERWHSPYQKYNTHCQIDKILIYPFRIKRMKVELSKEILTNLKGYIFPQEEISQWLKKYDLPTETLQCDSCDNSLSPNIPIADKLDRGVVFGPCSCGALPPVSLISACPKEREEDKLFFQVLSETLQ